MSQDLIFAPMGALALLTFLVLTFIPARRFRAVFARQITADDFKLGESAAVPGHVAVVNRAYMNLLEAPILFYVAALMYFVAGRVDTVALALAWAFVALRAMHSLIHLTSNAIRPRLVAFALSNFVLIGFWVMFFV